MFLKWFDNTTVKLDNVDVNKADWGRVWPFVMMHLACFAAFWVGCSKAAIITAVTLYWVRIFSIGAFYHRYFSHKTFQANRFWQFIFAIMCMTSIQRGPLWWAAHHRDHHIISDKPDDPHSPVHTSFWWSHCGWFLSQKFFRYNPERIKDFSKFPELRFLDRYDTLVPFCLAVFLFVLGQTLNYFHPEYETSGLQLLIWGFCISSVAVWHSTFSINSISHRFGMRAFPTKDNSRNSFILALFTMGEGWHNNHHHYPATARQGFKWWQIDPTFYILVLFEKIGIIHNLKRLPKHI